MSRLPPQPEFRPIRLNQALKPGAVVEAEESASEVVPIAGSVAVRIRLKATHAGELDVAILDATGETPVEGEPKGVLGVAVAADTEAVVEIANLMGEAWLEVKFTAGLDAATIEYVDVYRLPTAPYVPPPPAE